MINNLVLQRYLSKKNLEQFFEIFYWLLISAISAWVSWIIFQSSSLYLKTETDISVSDQNIQAALFNISEDQSANKQRTDFRILVNKNIFGQLTESALPAIPPVVVNTNKLKLGLVGTFITSGQSPYAIIENKKNSEQDVFELNENVFDTAKLIEIKTDLVKIDRNGEIEILTIEDFSSAGSDSDSSSPDSTVINVNGNELDEALSNLPLLLTQARAVPYFKDGVSVGLRLFAIRPGSLFEKIGLKNGDILKTINGNSMADITQAIKLFEKLKEEKKIDLTLERNREEQSLTYVIG